MLEPGSERTVAMELRDLINVLFGALFTVGGFLVKMLFSKMELYEKGRILQIDRLAHVEAETKNITKWLERIDAKLEKLVEREIDS